MTEDEDLSTEHRLGAFIKSQRRLKALSQRELAKLTDLSDPYVSQIERGLHQPSIKVLKSLAKALNVQVETMLSYAGLLDKFRRENALKLLDDDRLAIHDVSMLLGFSEPKAFRRAFKRWTGMSPRAHRNLRRMGQLSAAA